VLSRMGAKLEVAKSELEEGFLLAAEGRLPAARRRVERAIAAMRERGLAARAAAAEARAAAAGVVAAPAPAAEAAVPGAGAAAAPAPLEPEREAAAAASSHPRLDCYRIECFGSLRVFRPGESGPIAHKQWGSHKARQILAFLLATDPAGRGVARERILAAVWPEAPADTLDKTFHVTVSYLRRALGARPEAPPPLVQEGGQYRLAWPGGVWVDAYEFTAALARAAELEHMGQAYAAESELQRALDLVRGDLLDDVHFEWAEALRVKVRQDCFHALRKLARAALARWDFARARDLARRLLAAEPLDESAHRIVIQSLLEEDRRAEALAQYRLCARLLAQKLGLEPSPETRALLGRGAGRPGARLID